MNNQGTNILISGVGGQGILLASEILSEVLMLAGYDVKKNEIHGMSQRGGSVVSHLRYGRKVYSSIIPEGQADILLGFELLEAYRYLPLVREGGCVLANNLRIFPPPVTLGTESYPADIPGKIRAAFPDSLMVDGIDLALKAGNQRTVNTALLGVLSKRVDVEESCWQETLRQMVPAKHLEANLNAFNLGRNL